MEDNKEKTTKVVEEKKVKTKEPDVATLKNWCDQLLTQRNQLAERLNQITDVVNKLPWLFKVIENKEFFPYEFVERCKEEVVFIMTPPVEETKEETKEE